MKPVTLLPNSISNRLMIINYIDPSMNSLGGHHATQNKACIREFLAAGHRVNFITLQELSFTLFDSDERVNQIPLLPIYPYALSTRYNDIPKNKPLSTTFDLAATVYAQCYAQMPPADINIFPYAWHFMVYAWGMFLNSTGTNSAQAVFVPNGAPDTHHPFDPWLWKRAFAAVGNEGRSVRFGINKELISSYEALVCNAQQRVGPIPYCLESTAKTPKEKLECIGVAGFFFTDKKGQKNFLRYANQIVSRDINLLVHDSSGRLSSLASLPNTKVLGYVEDMSEVYQQIDALLLPYEIDFYQKNVSGVCMEALAAGLPVLLPLGTCLSSYVEKYGSGEHYVYGDETSLADAVERMAQDYPNHTARAYRGSLAYREVHGYKRHSQWLLGVGV